MELLFLRQSVWILKKIVSGQHKGPKGLGHRMRTAYTNFDEGEPEHPNTCMKILALVTKVM